MGNISEVEDSEEVGTVDEYRTDKCSIPPGVGETNIHDSPLDCIGVILSFMSEPRDILHFMSSCRMFYRFFRSGNDIQKVTFTLNFNIELKKPIEFIYNLRCIVYYAEKLTDNVFQFFPNLRILSIERSDRITSKIFRYLPNLEEFSISGFFRINYDFCEISKNIRKLSIKNKSSSYRYKDARTDDHTDKFTETLVDREELTDIELWRIDFNEESDKKFFQKLPTLVNLKRLILKFLSLGENLVICPEGLEELDLSFTKRHPDYHKKGHRIKIPKSLKKLHLEGLSDIHKVMFDSFRKCNLKDESQVYPSLTYLNVSVDDFQNVYGEIFDDIPKLFPNLKHLRMVKAKISDQGIDSLRALKKLESVRLTMKSQDFGNCTYLKRIFGVQVVHGIKFLIL